MKTKCTLAAFLAVSIVVGYFGSILLVTFADITDGRLAQVVGLVAAVQNCFLLIVGYYFGSSSGSAAKETSRNELLQKITSVNDNSAKTTATIDKTTTVSPDQPKEP